MAILSAIDGLGLLKRPCSVRFVSDSQYLVRGMNEWVPGMEGPGVEEEERATGEPRALEGVGSGGGETPG